ncbi:MAG: Rne/Rng family ribonuclease [Candidatus Omnitrophica bacterium]|nr:Rne/Rng family ribonuclease [Candidatus Omnitrophota bacterium]MCM8799537.1 Rne/Rng family ribonuclease [Candidatus Omnitrophota bacterium]
MTKEILINVEPQQTSVAIVNKSKLEEFYVERPQFKTIVGNIYKGRISEIVSSLNACFVDIGLEKKGFLYLEEPILGEFDTEIETNIYFPPLKKDQEILVQVTKEAFSRKGPRLSTNITLPGRYLVLMPFASRIGVSRRIEDEAEKKRLRQIMEELKLPKDVGFIVRTAAYGKTIQQLRTDAYFLLKLWSKIKRASYYKRAPALIYEDYDLILRVIRDSFTEDVNKVIVDSNLQYRRIYRFVKTFLRDLVSRIELYKGDDLFLEKGIEGEIQKIFETKIYLRSGAYIIIEPTEGLVVIDVNSGSFKGRLSLEEAAFRINMEAVPEIARQLRLRDLGGIIVIDFIDMQKEIHRQKVLQNLKEALKADRAHCDILGISRFGLVEMTRERIHKTVEAITYQSCPYCQGRGRLKAPSTTALYALKELKRYIKNNPYLKEIKLTLNPLVVDEILKDKKIIRDLERKYRINIELVSNPAFHLEEIKIS